MFSKQRYIGLKIKMSSHCNVQWSSCIPLKNHYFAGFQILTAVLLKIHSFWDVTLCWWVQGSLFPRNIVPSPPGSNSPRQLLQTDTSISSFCLSGPNHIPVFLSNEMLYTNLTAACQDPDFYMTQFLNLCQDGANPWVCLVIYLKNNGTSEE